MDIILHNFSWMFLNVLLAIIPIVFGWLMLKSRKTFLKFFSGVVWLVFLPNTAYVLTDIIHLFDDWNMISFDQRVILLAMYFSLMVLGVITFIFALYPLEKMVKKRFKKSKNNLYLFILCINFLVGVGIVLGRVFRVNSWEVVTNVPKVLDSTYNLFTSIELIVLTLFFSALCNFLYFFLKNVVMRNLLTSHLKRF